MFETKHGVLITQENDYLNVNSYFTYGVFEGAAGWPGAPEMGPPGRASFGA